MYSSDYYCRYSNSVLVAVYEPVNRIREYKKKASNKKPEKIAVERDVRGMLHYKVGEVIQCHMRKNIIL